MSGIEALLSRTAGLSVVGTSANQQEVTKKFRSLRPDVLVADVIQVDEGLRLLIQITKEFPNARIVILSGIDDPRFARTLLNKGISGYVLKTSTEAELVLAIRCAAEGRKFLDPTLAQAMFSAAAGEQPAKTNGHRFRPLSPREAQVLQAIVRGWTNKEIARALQLSTKTIETFRARIYSKLHFKNRFDLMRYAIQKGLISLHES